MDHGDAWMGGEIPAEVEAPGTAIEASCIELRCLIEEEISLLTDPSIYRFEPHAA